MKLSLITTLVCASSAQAIGAWNGNTYCDFNQDTIAEVSLWGSGKYFSKMQCRKMCKQAEYLQEVPAGTTLCSDYKRWDDETVDCELYVGGNVVQNTQINNDEDGKPNFTTIVFRAGGNK